MYVLYQTNTMSLIQCVHVWEPSEFHNKTGEKWPDRMNVKMYIDPNRCIFTFMCVRVCGFFGLTWPIRATSVYFFLNSLFMDSTLSYPIPRCNHPSRTTRYVVVDLFRGSPVIIVTTRYIWNITEKKTNINYVGVHART